MNRVSLRLPEKLLCYGQVIDWFLKQGRRFMAKDMVLFLLQNSSLAGKIMQPLLAVLNENTKFKLAYFIEI